MVRLSNGLMKNDAYLENYPLSYVLGIITGRSILGSCCEGITKFFEDLDKDLIRDIQFCLFKRVTLIISKETMLKYGIRFS